jgi:glucose/arabinose dehydrogenase
LAVVAALAAGPATAAASPPTVRVVASGLNSPKHLTMAPLGVLVDESGTGGPVGTANCVTAPGIGGSATTQYCEGPTGSIALITRWGTHEIVHNLPSVVEEDTGEVAGPSSVALTLGGLAISFQDELVNADGSNGLTGPAATEFGTLQLPSGRSVDLAAFAAANPQDPATLGGLGETAYDSDPYDAIPYRDGYLVTDAAANSLLYASPLGSVSLLARFSTDPEAFAPVGTVDAQAVPTAVAVGPDGALYVGELRGVPSQPGHSNIYRVVPGQEPTVWATGLTAVTAIAFDHRGRLLATELSTGGLLAAPSVPGALVRVSANGSQVTTLPVSGLTEPTGVAVAPDGTVFVSNNGTSAGTANPSGQVLAINGLG